MKESVFYQMILEEGEARGVAKGEVNEARRVLLRQGCRRFGPSEPDIVATIEAIGSIERLEGLLDRILDVSGWEELLADSPEGE